MVTRTEDDVAGFEFDWLAVDGDDAVGFFSTAGGGYAPADFLRDTDAHDRAIEEVRALPAVGEADCGLVLPPDRENTWRLMAERGVYAFDSDPLGGPYRRIATPRTPIRVERLPPLAAEVARRIRLPHLRFSVLAEISATSLRATGPQGESMSPEQLARTIYLGDRMCKAILLDGGTSTIAFRVDQISRIRSKSGEWEYYTDEDIADGAIVFGGVRSVDFGREIPIPNDWVELVSVEVVQTEAPPLYRFTLSLGAGLSDKEPGTREVTIVIVAADMYLTDPARPDLMIRE